MPTDAPLVPGEPAGLVDHHCHGVVETDLDRAAFEDLITESSVPVVMNIIAYASGWRY